MHHKINPNMLLAGKALVTIHNSNTGNRKTYRITKAKNRNIYFVGVKSDHNNYIQYIGSIFGDTEVFKHTKGSKVSPKSIAFLIFEWTYRNRHNLPDHVHIYHEGECLKCGRTLTTPTSIANGIGPVCAKQL